MFFPHFCAFSHHHPTGPSLRGKIAQEKVLFSPWINHFSINLSSKSIFWGNFGLEKFVFEFFEVSFQPFFHSFQRYQFLSEAEKKSARKKGSFSPFGTIFSQFWLQIRPSWTILTLESSLKNIFCLNFIHFKSSESTSAVHFFAPSLLSFSESNSWALLLFSCPISKWG
jgi:hypothetical protein